jgi:hypothetical protein
MEFPVGTSGSNLKEAFNGEMASGALLEDYLGIWSISLNFVPDSKECVNEENGKCEITVKIIYVRQKCYEKIIKMRNNRLFHKMYLHNRLLVR